MTGITRVSKESIFSDLNNLTVITTTSERYSDCFGFTEKEVFQALDLFGAENEKQNVKTWYDGFTFGTRRDIYNPWSITNFLKERKLRPYWADTSSNGLVNTMLLKASAAVKSDMEHCCGEMRSSLILMNRLYLNSWEGTKMQSGVCFWQAVI